MKKIIKVILIIITAMALVITAGYFFIFRQSEVPEKKTATPEEAMTRVGYPLLAPPAYLPVNLAYKTSKIYTKGDWVIYFYGKSEYKNGALNRGGITIHQASIPGGSGVLKTIKSPVMKRSYDLNIATYGEEVS